MPFAPPFVMKMIEITSNKKCLWKQSDNAKSLAVAIGTKLKKKFNKKNGSQQTRGRLPWIGAAGQVIGWPVVDDSDKGR